MNAAKTMMMRKLGGRVSTSLANRHPFMRQQQARGRNSLAPDLQSNMPHPEKSTTRLLDNRGKPSLSRTVNLNHSQNDIYGAP